MKEEKKENNVDIKEKVDFIPILIYFIGSFGLVILISMIIRIILGVKIGNNEDAIKQSQNIIVTIITNILLFITFAIIYREKIKFDLKRLTKENLKDTMLFALLALVLDIIISTLFSKINLNMENQNTVNNMMDVYFCPIILIVAFITPFIEEVVFRYSFGSLIKNNIVFILVSSILFGLAHGIEISTLLYVLIGVLFAIIYLKTNKNLLASVIAHIILNTGAVILMLINLI